MKIKLNIKNVYLDMICMFVILICCVFNQFYFVGYISILIFFCYLIWLFIVYPDFYIKYAHMAFAGVAAITGVFFVEYGNLYLSELDCLSRYIGCLPFLTLSYWILIKTIICVDKYLNKGISKKIEQKDNKNNNFLKYMSWIILFICILMFMHVVKYPSFIIGVDRFEYLSKYKLIVGIWNKLDTNMPILLLLPIAYYSYEKNKISIITIIIYVMYSLWIGNKFGIFFKLMCIVLLVLYKNISSFYKKKMLKYVIRAFTTFAIIITITILINEVYSSTKYVEYLTGRIAQQGQIFWRIFDISNQTHYNEFYNEISSIFGNNGSVTESIGTKYGIYKMMYLSAPKNLVEFKLSTGSRYTEAGFACAYYYAGNIGLIMFALLQGILLSFFANNLLLNLNRNNYVASIIYLRLYFLTINFCSMFLFYDFFDLFSLLSYVYLFICNLQKEKNKKLKVI